MTLYTDQPDIMAIGDSMYQGIRSLSFLPAMVQHSAPKQVANMLGLNMTVPDLQQPLLFDMEAELAQGGLVSLIQHIQPDCLKNLKAWPLDQPWSQHEAFDNIAVGGAEIASLLDDKYSKYIDQVSSLSAALAVPNQPTAQLAGTIGNLWYALNNCYTLNPRHRDEQKDKSPLQQVADRQPRTLLINIGSNEGLFMAGFAGNLSTLDRVATIPDMLKPVADQLKSLPARVERIVFNSLIRPRFIPNLMPSAEHENDYPGDAYYYAYGPRIADTQQKISGQKLKDFDDLIAQVNAEAQNVLKQALGNRVVFADIYAACSPFDGKHYMGRGLPVPAHAKTLSNKPIEPLPFGYHGGFAGLDNMHPTVPGYAAIADVVLAALGRSDLRTDKDAAYASDTLLNNLHGPQILIADAEFSLVGSLGVFRLGSAMSTSTV